MTQDNSIPEVPFPTIGALNARAVMSRLQISKSGLYRLVKSGKLVPLAAFSRNRLFSVESLLNFLNDKKK